MPSGPFLASKGMSGSPLGQMEYPKSGWKMGREPRIHVDSCSYTILAPPSKPADPGPNPLHPDETSGGKMYNKMAYRCHQSLSDATNAINGRLDDWARNAIVLQDLYQLFYDPKPTQAEISSPSSQSDEGSDVERNKSPGTSRMTRFPYRLKPIYWKENSFLLARGTWFLEASGGNWQPLDGNSPDLVRLIEEQHLKMFANQPIRSTAPASLSQVVCEVKDAAEQRVPGTGAEVRWYSVDDVLLYNHSQSSRLWRYLNLPSSGTRLMRGYRSEARVDDELEPYTDLIFVIHGIGQKQTQTKILKTVTDLREISDCLLLKHFSGKKHRPLLLPVDWRTELDLSERLIQSITPNFLESMRGYFNETLMDLMYYASPVHGHKIVLALSKTMNRMYQTFVSHHPYFESRNGRICLAAHSLGSVIAHDILTVGTEPMGVDDRISITSRAIAETCRLVFPVHHMFSLGSPLGVFLAARNVRGRQILHPPGAASNFRLHNIYHPADVVAYRIEPLVSEIYEIINPLRINKATNCNPKPYESMPNEPIRKTATKDTSPTSSSSSSKTDSSPSSNCPVPQSVLQTKEMPKLETPTEPPKKKPKHAKVEIPPEDALPYRIDYEMIPGRVIHEYWAAMTAHDSYWSSQDVVMYMLSVLYGFQKKTKKKKHEDKELAM